MKTAPLLASALGFLAITAAPALAEGKADRARAAIAEASGKLDASAKVGTGGDAPRLQAQAQAALRTAQESLASGHKEDAIAQANHASELADMALNEAQRNRTMAERAQRTQANSVAVSAQADAAAANARADQAEQAAAAAAADAAAARAAPPVVVAAPPAPSTTVTTETTKSTAATATTTKPAVRRVVHRVTHAKPRVATTEKTTTTVTTN
ncbi:MULTISPECIES: hypothetical protein [unclassified Sphingomonas]|uniref:hypothetical protein n=1 Tax=unclassified Sphingomonas TaxID=196159 RepID=UPI00226AF6E8|nr:MULTISPECIES: hypothetical protein [unclassified Sphingomonas]